MRIALDTNPLYITRAGVARYVRGLKQGFAELDHASLDVTELAWPVENFGFRQPMRAMRTVYREVLWTKTAARLKLLRCRPDILHMTSGLNVAPGPRIPLIITLYDLAIVRHPSRYRRWHRSRAAGRIRRLHDMDRIICISRFTADEAMAIVGLPANRLEVVPLAGQFACDRSDAAVRPRLALPEEYFLFVGSLEPGKNLRLLRQVYARARETGQPLPPLVIVGARWGGVPTEGPPPPDWIYAGRIPDEQLLFLYRDALALVFPSVYEGFGLPPLEAMSQGCPVICSPVASLPEVVGDAACMAEQTAESYLDAMQRLCQSEELRLDLSLRGVQRAGLFSWRRCAAETRDVYTKVLKG